MTDNTIFTTPKKSFKQEENGSPLLELASLASSFVFTPQSQIATSRNSFKDEHSPLKKSESQEGIATAEKLKTRLNFDEHDMDLCSKLAVLKSSPKKGAREKKGRSKAALKLFLKDLNGLKPQEKRKAAKMKRPKQKKLRITNPANRKKRKNEWNDREIVILLQMTKLMIDCELKSVAKALFECIERSPGKSYGRAAEKKLKRMEIFENWKKCDKEKIIKNINKKLIHLNVSTTEVEPKVFAIATKYREQELDQRISNRVRPKYPVTMPQMELPTNSRPRPPSIDLRCSKLSFQIIQCMETMIRTLEVS